VRSYVVDGGAHSHHMYLHPPYTTPHSPTTSPLSPSHPHTLAPSHPCTPSETYTNSLHPSVVDIVAQARAQFPSAVAILSNSVGTDDDDGYAGAKLTEAGVGLPVIRHRQKKPACLEEVLAHFRGVLGSVQPGEICVVGKTDLYTAPTIAHSYSITLTPTYTHLHPTHPPPHSFHPLLHPL